MCAAKCSPLGTPKGWSKKQKAKTCRSAARFLTLFASSPIDPSGAEFYSTIYSVGADARCCGMPHWSIDRCANPSAPKPGCCAVAKQSKPQLGFEAHERARFAGWRRSLCAAKRALSEVAGTFSVPFGSPKGTHSGRKPLNRVKRRRVARNESRRGTTKSKKISEHHCIFA